MAIASKDRYTWAVVTTDERYIGEYDRPEGRGFAEVDDRRVKQIKLESSHNLLHSHYVEVPLGAEAIFFRRRRVEVDLMKSEIMPGGTTHCIGWRRGKDAVYLFVNDDGSTLLTTNLQAV